MARSIPQLTIVMIDNVVPGLSAAALSKTLKQVTPARVIWETDPTIKSMFDVENIRWGVELQDSIKTTHMLCIQYDGYVLDGTRWNDDWFQYDYIGAPWPWHPHHKVGNGGFSLRSLPLMYFLMENFKHFPVKVPEDEAICREYRDRLEGSFGFKFAPEEIAREFSFEREEKRDSFGFHGIFNFPKVLPKSEWEFLKANAPEFVRNKFEWTEALEWEARNS